jgi:DNA-binding NarL/FixJ family response regulator
VEVEESESASSSKPAAAASPIRVFLAEDHHLIRSGLKILIDAEPDMTVIGEAADGVVAVEQIQALLPDVAVMDLAMPRLGGADAMSQLRTSAPTVRFLTLTAHEEHAYLEPVLAEGISCMLKRSAATDFTRAIRIVAEGGVYLDKFIAAWSQRADSAEVSSEPRLSAREAEVIRLIAEGHSMKAIGERLRVSTRTLETYRMRAMEKLSLKTRADIVRYVASRGWLSPMSANPAPPEDPS